jgi:hypothetical protein
MTVNTPRNQPVDMTTRKPASGIFNKPTSNQAEASPNNIPDNLPVQNNQDVPRPPKENFPDVFRQQEEMIQNTKAATQAKKDPDAENIDQLNKALSGDNKSSLDEDIVKISKEDMALAEQLIFNGYTECNVEMVNFPGRKFAICSTNAEEMGLIDEIVFEKIRSVKQNDDGSVEMPENSIRALRNALFISVSYRGVDGKDISTDAICHINTIKRAILKLGDIYNSGELAKADDLKKSIKQAMIKRATIVKRMPTPLIDFITNEKYNFDVKMLKIMNEKNIVPLS